MHNLQCSASKHRELDRNSFTGRRLLPVT